MDNRRWTMTGALLLGFAARVLPILRESLWRDEVDVIRFAFAPLSDVFGNFLRAGMNGPLYLTLMRVWLTLGGANDFSLRYFSALCGVLGIALVFALGRLLKRSDRSKQPAPFVFAALLMALSPVMVWYSGEGKMYALLVVITLFALVCVLRGWWMAFALAATAGFYVHILFALFVPVAFLFFISSRTAWSGRGGKTHPHPLPAGGVLAFAFLTLPYLPILVWQWQAWSSGFVTGHVFYPLDQALLNLFYAWSVGVGAQFPLGLGWQFGVFGAAAFAVLALWALANPPLTPPGGRGILLIWLLLPAALITLISTRAPVFEPRYLLWCAPAVYLLLGIGYRRWIAVIAIAICGMGLLGQWMFPIRPDTRSAAAHITQNAAPGDAVLFNMPYAKFTFEHYWGGNSIPTLDAPYTNDGALPDEFLQAQVPSAKRVWLVESEPEMWDARHLTREWLTQHAAELEHFSAHQIRVWLFEAR